ncbi:MAG: DUF2085 domain-containing protein [Aggregatilineales bacterium]
MAEKAPSAFGLRLNIWLLRISRNWIRVVTVFLAIYVSLPVVAPTLMAAGLTGPGRALYTIYSPFCHQFGFRSFYLFGDQPVYPREIAGSDWTPYEAYTNEVDEFSSFSQNDEFTLDWTLAHKNYPGNDQMGYKTALCERDMFIYFALFIGAVLYSRPAVRRRLRPLPIWLYVILGVLPIAIDGFSQLLGYPPFELWAPRETLPVFRVVTGFLFGIMTAWLGFPYINSAMQDTQHEIEHKLRGRGIDV